MSARTFAAERGFTLPELMVSVALLAILSGVAAGIGSQAWQEHETLSGYQADVADVRRALATVEVDLRDAGQVDRRSEDFVVTTPTERVTYRHRDHELQRIDAAGRVQTLARCFAGFAIRTEGALAHVNLVMRPRLRGETSAGHPATTLETTVLMRNREMPR
ncbi:MAG: prepilin-type N-terminal cleavage/methylation domain-containing protein [bacterium]|nr:prepilin-type N-terminal cleavage/methylation domain-containing protein [bacterium]